MRIVLELKKEKALPGLSLLFLKKIVAETCKEAFPKVFGKGVTVKLDVASVSDDSIAQLNADYRGKKKPTDILSFGSFESSEAVSRSRRKEFDLGQIILSPDFIQRSAREDGVSWKHEFAFVFSHGVLHLLGYDHSPKMFETQDTVTARIVKKSSKKSKS
ncbi:MAG: rRNA maturation RNase YbeY [Candidatus Moraniibacteriota bacterium]